MESTAQPKSEGKRNMAWEGGDQQKWILQSQINRN
jgi:hypothetical protein